MQHRPGGRERSVPMSILLPLDDNGHPIHVLGFDYRGTQRLAVTRAASVRDPAPVPRDLQRVTPIAPGPRPLAPRTAPGPCRFAVGHETVTADPQASAFLYPGQYVDVPLRRGGRYVAF